MGAVLGRDFAYEMLRAITALDEPRLRDVLGRLVEAELLYQRGRPPRARYMFKHALIQDAAYQSLVRRTRQQYHRQVAELLESNFADTVESSPELVAHHYSEAGAAGPAVTYWLRAGENATRRSANLEAIGHLTAGLAQLAQLPEAPERAKQEFALQRLLGQASFAAKAMLLLRQPARSAGRGSCAPRSATMSASIRYCSAFCFSKWPADTMQMARRPPSEMLERARRHGKCRGCDGREVSSGDRPKSIWELSICPPILRGAVPWYSGVPVGEAARLAYEYGLDLGALSYAYGSWCWWLLGYPDQALRFGDEALVDSPIASSTPILASARTLLEQRVPRIPRRMADCRRARRGGDRSAQERGLAMVVAVGRIMRGAARAMLEPRDEAVAEIREALTAYRATGARFQSTYHLILLAQALAACGRYDEGRFVLREAAALVEETGERFFEAEIYRLEGNLLLDENGSAEAEACYVKALDVARAQEARSLELRAAIGHGAPMARSGQA